jgi:hypothetical protein
MAEPCPVGMIRYMTTRGPCPALLWREDDGHLSAGGRYVCGLLARAQNRPLLKRLLARWIAAGIGCDSAT